MGAEPGLNGASNGLPASSRRWSPNPRADPTPFPRWG